MNNVSNYTQDRSCEFKHHMTDEVAPPSAMTVQEYIRNERARDRSKRRDWYLEAKNSNQIDSVTLRSSFSNSRSYVSPSPVQEISHHKSFLLLGLIMAFAVGSFLYFFH